MHLKTKYLFCIFNYFSILIQIKTTPISEIASLMTNLGMNNMSVIKWIHEFEREKKGNRAKLVTFPVELTNIAL